MNVAIYCGSSLGNNKIYEESTKLLAQKLVQKDFKIVYGGSLQGLMGIKAGRRSTRSRRSCSRRGAPGRPGRAASTSDLTGAGTGGGHTPFVSASDLRRLTGLRSEHERRRRTARQRDRPL